MKATVNGKQQMKYEIGGLLVRMTEAAAERWNRGLTTLSDLKKSLVADPDGDRVVTLRRATSERLEPELARTLHGSPANKTE